MENNSPLAYTAYTKSTHESYSANGVGSNVDRRDDLIIFKNIVNEVTRQTRPAYEGIRVPIVRVERLQRRHQYMTSHNPADAMIPDGVDKAELHHF